MLLLLLLLLAHSLGFLFFLHSAALLFQGKLLLFLGLTRLALDQLAVLRRRSRHQRLGWRKRCIGDE